MAVFFIRNIVCSSLFCVVNWQNLMYCNLLIRLSMLLRVSSSLDKESSHLVVDVDDPCFSSYMDLFAFIGYDEYSFSCFITFFKKKIAVAIIYRCGSPVLKL